ncbi:unnamed protein product [Clonostachys solani]|uniref:Uncharacterized protein n=1 Tax=Clonostachys solani TaxID=160281 RepID=A0A9P0EDG4_9HYPO|nr:unnamed protein product [Clonostachys solani]
MDNDMDNTDDTCDTYDTDDTYDMDDMDDSDDSDDTYDTDDDEVLRIAMLNALNDEKNYQVHVEPRNLDLHHARIAYNVLLRCKSIHPELDLDMEEFFSAAMDVCQGLITFHSFADDHCRILAIACDMFYRLDGSVNDRWGPSKLPVRFAEIWDKFPRKEDDGDSQLDLIGWEKINSFLSHLVGRGYDDGLYLGLSEVRRALEQPVVKGSPILMRYRMEVALEWITNCGDLFLEAMTDSEDSDDLSLHQWELWMKQLAELEASPNWDYEITQLDAGTVQTGEAEIIAGTCYQGTTGNPVLNTLDGGLRRPVTANIRDLRDAKIADNILGYRHAKPKCSMSLGDFFSAIYDICFYFPPSDDRLWTGAWLRGDPFMDCRLRVAVEWIINCGDILFMELNLVGLNTQSWARGWSGGNSGGSGWLSLFSQRVLALMIRLRNMRLLHCTCTL